MLKKPLKAPGEGVSIEQLKGMTYPIACSAKLDGIRAMVTDDGVMSSSLKRLGNLHMQACLDDPALLGLDGELVVGNPYSDINDDDDDVFNRTTGAIRRSSGKPDFKFYVFDDFTCKSWGYYDRWIAPMLAGEGFDNPYVVILEQRICETWQEAVAYERELILQGYEGMMARTLSAPYKEGRVTIKEGYIYKRKPLEQSEGVIVDFFEQMENKNVKTTDALGNSVRSSHKDNKVGKGTLGGFIVEDPRWKETFRVATITGGTKEWRQKMYNDPMQFMGKLLTYTYQGYGSIHKPRIPVGKAEFRSTDDMTSF